MKASAEIVADLCTASVVGFALRFLTTQLEVREFISTIDRKLNEDPIIWLCYPKASAKNYNSGFN